MMAKRGNALMVLLVLVFDVLMCALWYITAFPLEPASTLDTMGGTILVMLGTAMALILTYITYGSCISEED